MREGEAFHVDAPIAEYSGVDIYYEDNHLLIVSKPPNLPTQADDSRDEDLLSLMKRYIGEKYQKPGAVYLGLVHRLDRPVGGLLALARTSKAAARLSAQVREKTLHRLYLAVAQGEAEDAAELTDILLKDSGSNTSRVVAPGTPGGKEARLQYRTLSRQAGKSLVMVRLFTGRSHQIRVQMSHAGLPLWGDARYGGGTSGQQIALFAAALGLVHPTQKTPVQVFAQPPFARPPFDAFAGQAAQIRAALEAWML